MCRLIYTFLAATFVTLLFSTHSYAQTRVGIKAGISTFDVSAPPVIVRDEGGVPAYEMSIQDTKIGLHIGFFLQAQFGPVFIQPELLVNTQTVDFKFKDLSTVDPQPDQIRDEIYQTLDFPLIIGAKIGPVRLGGGPMGHLFLNSNSDINDFEGYSQDFTVVTWGWQAGVGVDIWKLHIDGRYEGNLTNFGEHMRFHGQAYEFEGKPSRWIASIGISF